MLMLNDVYTVYMLSGFCLSFWHHPKIVLAYVCCEQCPTSHRQVDFGVFMD